MLSKAAALRPVVPGRTSSASFKVIRSLRPPDPPAGWQVSWGFGADLLTGQAGKSPKIFLQLSGVSAYGTKLAI